MLKKLQDWPILGPLVTFLDSIHPKVRAGSLVGLAVAVVYAIVDGLGSAQSVSALIATGLAAAAAYLKSA